MFIGIGCKRDELVSPDLQVFANSNRRISINESKDYFQKNINHSSLGFTVNQSDWAGLEPVWGAANEVVLNDLSTVVIVPIDDSTIIVNPYLDAYVVFFEDSLDQVQMHVLFFQADTIQYVQGIYPTIANFSGLIWEFYDEEDTYAVFSVEQGVVIDRGCSSTFADYAGSIDSSSVLPRTIIPMCTQFKWRMLEPYSPSISGIWMRLKLYFALNGTSNGSTGWSGFGSLGTGAGSFGFGGSTSGSGSAGGTGSVNLSDIFSEWEIKEMQKVADWMNDTYNLSWSVNELYALMSQECIWAIPEYLASLAEPTIDEPEEPTCVKAFYLGSLLGLSESEIQCISTPEVLNELYDMVENGEVRNACNPNQTSEEILGDAISIACQNGGVNNIGDIYKAFDDNDKIVVSPTVPSGCPKYNCIFEEMMNGPLGTTFVCDVLSSFDEDSETPLIVRAIDFSVAPGYEPTNVASVSIIGGIINLSINTDFCNSATTRFAFETLQHELIHADIRRRLFEDFNWTGQNLTFLVAFDQLVTEHYGFDATIEEHAIMIQYYLDVMVASLIEMNGGIGVYEDFVGLVLTGFPSEVYSYIGLTTADVLSLYNDYLNATTGQGNINNVLSNCN